MPDVNFHGAIGQITTRPTKDGEPETIVQIKMDGLPSDVVALMRCVGKGGRVTFAPYQREMELVYEGRTNGAVQGELWDVAKTRTVDPPEPEEQPESNGPALPITWTADGDAVDANGVALDLHLNWSAAWTDPETGEILERVWVATFGAENCEHAVGLVGVEVDDEPGLLTAQDAAITLYAPPGPWSEDAGSENEPTNEGENQEPSPDVDEEAATGQAYPEEPRPNDEADTPIPDAALPF